MLLPTLDPLYSDSLHFGLTTAAATFSGDLFDQATKLDERLNAMIDRAIKRLIHIKAVKQVLDFAPQEARGEVVKLAVRKNSAR